MALLLSTADVGAQSIATATLRGVVVDETGGVLPGAVLTLTATDTQIARSTVTDKGGAYAFGGVFAGTYLLRVELAGFRVAERPGIALSPQDTSVVNVRLEVGTLRDRVTVQASGDRPQSATGAREAVIRADQLETLPAIGRSALELLRILPGVVSPPPGALEAVGFYNGANHTDGYVINGVRSSGNAVHLDGSDLTDFGCNCRSVVTLAPDMVQDVKIQTSNYAAEHGSTGISISAVTKSGSSIFRGSLYHHERDYHLAANDRSNSLLGLPKPKSSFHFPGGTVGGPVVVPGWGYTKGRDRLFFFTGLEWQQQRADQGATPTVVPTLLQRQGLFTESLAADGQNLGQPIGAVLVPPGYPGEGTEAPGADLAPYVHPIGRVLASLYPLPNGRYQDNRFNYAATRLLPVDRLVMRARLDWNVSDRTRAYLSLAREDELEQDAYGAWGPTTEVPLPSPIDARNHGRSAVGQIVSVLTPAMTNEVLVSWSGVDYRNEYADPAVMRLSSNHVAWSGSFPGQSPYLPGVVAWSGALASLSNPYADTYLRRGTLQAADTLTRVAGSHSLKFGVSLAQLQTEKNTANDTEGTFVFTPWTPRGTGNIVGDLLTGRPFQYSQGTRPPDGRFREWHLDAFAQDAWRLWPNLTVEVGVRAGFWPNEREQHGLGGYFDPARYSASQPQWLESAKGPIFNGVCYVADGCAPRGILPDRSPFAMPRLNAAWDIGGDGTNVLRGGYGLFFNRPPSNLANDRALLMAPAAYHVSQDAFSGDGLGSGNGLSYDTAGETTMRSQNGNESLDTQTPQSFSFPKTHSFSLSYARRIGFGQVVEAAYVGTRGRSLVSSINGNPLPEGALLHGVLGNADLSVPINRMVLDTAAVNALRLYQAYPAITVNDFGGVSDYDSMQITLTRQTGRRLQYALAYTLARTRGTFGDDYSRRDPFDARRTYGVSQADRTHTLTVSWNAVLPDAARRWLDGWFGRALLNGWQLSGISTLVSGTPIWLRFDGAAGDATVLQAYYGTPDIWGPIGPSLAPVYSCDPRLHGKKVGEKVLDIGCIGLPAFGELGQALPPYNIRRPPRSDHDLAVFKNFVLPRAQRLQFRATVFNVFNTAYATELDTTLLTECNRFEDHVPDGIGGYVDHVCDPVAGFHFTDDTRRNFGTIVSMTGHRVIQLAVRYSF